MVENILPMKVKYSVMTTSEEKPKARLSPSERWRRHRIAVELWKARNRHRYAEQKRRLAARPAYLKHRREMYARSKALQKDLSTRKDSILNEYIFTESDKRSNQRSDTGWNTTEGAPERDWPCAA